MLQATKATADVEVFSVNLTSWYSSASFLLANEKRPPELCQHQILGGLVGLSWLLSVVSDSLDLLQFSLYCLNVRYGKTLLYIKVSCNLVHIFHIFCDSAIVLPTCPITPLTQWSWRHWFTGVHTFAFKITWGLTYLMLWLIREQRCSAFLPRLALSQ